jgi:hypothetical protein
MPYDKAAGFPEQNLKDSLKIECKCDLEKSKVYKFWKMALMTVDSKDKKKI